MTQGHQQRGLHNKLGRGEKTRCCTRKTLKRGDSPLFPHKWAGNAVMVKQLGSRDENSDGNERIIECLMETLSHRNSLTDQERGLFVSCLS